MKKIGYLVIFSTLLFISCSGTSNENPASAAVKTTTQAKDGGDGQNAATTGKTVHLNAQAFKAKVMNYEKNPQQWVFEGDKPAIVDFYADWCRPCRMIAPIMEELATEYEGKIDIYKVDTDDERELASVFGIQSLPSVLFIPMTSKPSLQKGAMSKEAYKQIIDDYLLKKQ